MTKNASPPTVLGPVSGPESCEMCGANGLKTELVRDPFIYGAGPKAVELVADVPVHTCPECDVSFTGEAAEIRGTKRSVDTWAFSRLTRSAPFVNSMACPGPLSRA